MKSNQIHRCSLAKRFVIFVILPAALSLGWAAVGLGVVIDDGDGSGNTTAPLDDPGFSNVAIRGSATAVYLGNRWALTASHVGAGTVTLNGIDYSHIPSETVRLTNPSGLSGMTDVVLFRLEEDPGLPALHLPCESIGIGSTLTLVGGGRDRQPEKSFWNVDVISGDNNDVWTLTDSEAGSDQQGYLTQDSQSVRWGQSLVTLASFDTESGFGDVLSFQSSFDPILDVTSLAAGVRGDSGGGVFQKNRGIWELVGMIHAVSLLESQPSGTRSAVYGNETFIADLFRYSDQLRELADFEPQPGDIDGDGVVDATDIDSLLDVIRQPAFASCHYDLVDDDGLNEADLSAILAAAGGLLGDSNLDGAVGFIDFLALSRSFGKSGTTWSDGDFDGDDQVTFADFLILSQNFGLAIELAEVGSAEPVPEPATQSWVLVLTMLVGLRRLLRQRISGRTMRTI